METKICKDCNKSSDDTPFNIIKATAKYNCRCKECYNAMQRMKRLNNIDTVHVKEQAYREANRERIRTQYCSKEYAKAKYLLNKEKILARHNEYNTTHAAIISAQKHKYYLANKEHIIKQSAKYYAEHRDEYYARNSKRRALLLSASIKLSVAEEARITLLYKIARKVQQLTGVNMHVDHIYPLNGKTVCGLHCLSNLQIITAKENMEKSNKFPDDKYLKGYKWQQSY